MVVRTPSDLLTSTLGSLEFYNKCKQFARYKFDLAAIMSNLPSGIHSLEPVVRCLGLSLSVVLVWA